MNPAIKAKLSSKVKLSTEEMSEYKEFLVDRQAFNQHSRECYSLWCDMLYKLTITNHFRDEVGSCFDTMGVERWGYGDLGPSNLWSNETFLVWRFFVQILYSGTFENKLVVSGEILFF